MKVRFRYLNPQGIIVFCSLLDSKKKTNKRNKYAFEPNFERRASGRSNQLKWRNFCFHIRSGPSMQFQAI